MFCLRVAVVSSRLHSSFSFEADVQNLFFYACARMETKPIADFLNAFLHKKELEKNLCILSVPFTAKRC